MQLVLRAKKFGTRAPLKTLGGETQDALKWASHHSRQPALAL